MTSIIKAINVRAKIKQAIKVNFLPGVVLQMFALSIVLLYFFYAPAQPTFDFIGALKLKYSTSFAIISTAIFGGLLPFVILFLKKRVTKHVISHLLFNILLWAFMGWLIDSFYQLQAFIFGAGVDLTTIVKKTLLDQFVFSVFITSPFITAMYIWRESNFNGQKTRNELRVSFFKEKLPATIFSTWIVWLPAVTLIYSMPLALQLPLFNLVLCFFVLLISALNKD
ncbi:MAG: hypothetical protein ACI9IT_000476 [Glaciecola sp.]